MKIQVVDRVVTASSAEEAVAAVQEVAGVLFVRKARDLGDGTFLLTIDLVM